MKYGIASVAKEILNDDAKDITLTSYKDIQIIYNTINKQVHLHNISSTEIYYVVYAFEGNTAQLRHIPYTAYPDPAMNKPFELCPNKKLYFTNTSEFKPMYDISRVGDRFILDDLTIYCDPSDTYGADMNNQHISNEPNKNRILMSELITRI